MSVYIYSILKPVWPKSNVIFSVKIALEILTLRHIYFIITEFCITDHGFKRTEIKRALASKITAAC